MRVPWLLLAAIIGLTVLVWATQHWWATRGPSMGGRRREPTPGIGVWRVEAKVEQLHGRHPAEGRHRVTVVLRDAKGRELETPGIGFAFDGTPLAYAVGAGNYYDRHPYYRLDGDVNLRIDADRDLLLAMTCSNAPPEVMARVRTPAALSASHFQVPVRHPRHRDLVVTWAGLGQPAEVLVYRTMERKDRLGNVTIEAGGPYADDAIRHRIGGDASSRDRGQWTIPSTYFSGATDKVVTSITLEISAANQGEFLIPVHEGSAITAFQKLTLGVELLSP